MGGTERFVIDWMELCVESWKNRQSHLSWENSL